MDSLERATQPRDLSGYALKDRPASTVMPQAPLPGVPQRRAPVSHGITATANSRVASSQNQADYAARRAAVSTKPAAAQTYDILSGPRPIGKKSYSKGEYVTLGANSTLSLLNLSATGYIDSLWLGIPVSSNITITIDNVIAYSGPSQHFFAGVYADSQPAVSSKWFMFNAAAGGGGGVGYTTALAIPFGGTIDISVTETTGALKTIFWEIGYQLGASPTVWGNANKFRAVSGTANPAAYSLVTLLDINASGRLAGIYYNYDGFPGNVLPRTAPLEGDITISSENGPLYQSSGTEDYLFMSDFFNGFAQNSSGLDCALTVKTADTWAGYRIHANDPIAFTRALNITWAAGEIAHAPYTGSPRFYWCVWYYTQ